MTRGSLPIVDGFPRLLAAGRVLEASTKSIGAFNGATASGAKRTAAAWSGVKLSSTKSV